MEIGDKIWYLVNEWSHFEKDTIGKQFVRAADSIAANLSEGLGRYHFREAKNFSYYSRGSLFETKTWLSKAFSGKLISGTKNQEILEDLNTLGK